MKLPNIQRYFKMIFFKKTNTILIWHDIASEGLWQICEIAVQCDKMFNLKLLQETFEGNDTDEKVGSDLNE